MKMKLKHFKLYYRIRIMCRHSLGRKLKRGRIDLLQLNTMKCNDQNRNNECHTFAQSMQLFNIFWLKTINNCFISVCCCLSIAFFLNVIYAMWLHSHAFIFVVTEYRSGKWFSFTHLTNHMWKWQLCPLVDWMKFNSRSITTHLWADFVIVCLLLFLTNWLIKLAEKYEMDCVWNIMWRYICVQIAELDN